MTQPQRCMADLPPTRELIGLKIPYGAWEPDTLITDTFGNPMFSVLDVQHHAMGSYEAIFGDENGHKLCYVKRRLITKYWKDGWDFCTYKPNFPGQPKYKERDMYGKSVYPFSFLQVRPMKCRYAYSIHKEDLENMDVQLEAMHGWLGSMTVCCTPMVRFGKWQMDFHRPGAGDPEINIDQSKNLLEVERGNDLLAALCIAYAFDKALCQPLVTIIGYQEKEHMDEDDDSLESYEPDHAARGFDFDEEDPQYAELPAPGDDQIAGYLGYEDDEPEIAGYLEAPPPEDDDHETKSLPYQSAPPPASSARNLPYRDEKQPSGYLESAPKPYSDRQQPSGYLESEPKPYRDDPEPPAGYLESEPSSYNEQDEPAGYLESDPSSYSDRNEPSGYLEASESSADRQQPSGYLEASETSSERPSGYLAGESASSPAGYLETSESYSGSSPPGGYLESTTEGDESTDVAGYLEGTNYGRDNQSEVAGYIDNEEFEPHASFASSDQYSHGGYIEQDRFDDE